MRKAVRGIIFRDNHLLVMKRNKFGHFYCTLPGGGIKLGETAEHALARELNEETSLSLGDARLVFVENAGDPYGIQYIYLVDYVSGEPQLSPKASEAIISAMGQNVYEPAWLPISELPQTTFISERLKQYILTALQQGFPTQPQTI